MMCSCFCRHTSRDQDLPEQWANTKKTSILTKQQVAPLQANEVVNIRRKSADFDVRQHKFRETFRKIPPFFYTCDEPYGYLDEVSARGRCAPVMCLRTGLAITARQLV